MRGTSLTGMAMVSGNGSGGDRLDRPGDRLDKKTLAELNLLVGSSVSRLQNKITRIGNKPRNYGTEDNLSRADVELITCVINYSDLSITEIAAHLGITKSAVSQLSTSLIKRGYLVREASPDHGKIRHLRPTAKAKTAGRGIDRQFDRLCESLAGISKSELIGYLKVAARLEAFIGEFEPVKAGTAERE